MSLLAFLQVIAELPIRQWTLQDVILIGGALINISGIAGLGAVALYRLGKGEKEQERLREGLHGVRNDMSKMLLAWEHRTTLVEEKATAAHIRLDAMRPEIDWGRVMPMLEKVMDMEREKGERMDRILEKLSER